MPLPLQQCVLITSHHYVLRSGSFWLPKGKGVMLPAVNRSLYRQHAYTIPPMAPSLTSYGVQTHLMKKGGHVHMYFLALQGAKLISPGYQKTAEYCYTLFSTTRAKYPLVEVHNNTVQLLTCRIQKYAQGHMHALLMINKRLLPLQRAVFFKKSCGMATRHALQTMEMEKNVSA